MKRLQEEEMSTEVVEANRREEEDAKAIPKSEMSIMIQELMGMGLISAKVNTGPSELKLELVPNYVKLEDIKNYLSWCRRVCVLLGGKGLKHYLEETCVEPAD